MHNGINWRTPDSLRQALTISAILPIPRVAHLSLYRPYRIRVHAFHSCVRDDLVKWHTSRTTQNMIEHVSSRVPPHTPSLPHIAAPAPPKAVTEAARFTHDPTISPREPRRIARAMANSHCLRLMIAS